VFRSNGTPIAESRIGPMQRRILPATGDALSGWRSAYLHRAHLNK
jgi:hypothetical protein